MFTWTFRSLNVDLLLELALEINVNGKHFCIGFALLLTLEVVEESCFGFFTRGLIACNSRKCTRVMMRELTLT